MYTLDSFYRSDDWIRFRKILVLDRVDAEGNLICEHCGKPIVNQYDAIAHHKIPLTEDNVNDTDISLNPDHIAMVHHRCHNYIHNKFGYVRPEIYLVYGSPLSGKSAYIESIIDEGDLIIDIDRIWKCVSGMPTYRKPPVLNAVVFGIRDYLFDSVRIRRGRWNNAYIVGGYPLISERERICKSLGAREIYVESTKEDCLTRLSDLSNELDLDTWTGYINDWWDKFTPPLHSY
jgi:hypothetical protein